MSLTQKICACLAVVPLWDWAMLISVKDLDQYFWMTSHAPEMKIPSQPVLLPDMVKVTVITRRMPALSVTQVLGSRQSF